MNDKGFTMETIRRVWNDGDGNCTEIGPDAVGTGMIELRYRDEDGILSNSNRISFPKKAGPLIAQAIIAASNEEEIHTP